MLLTSYKQINEICINRNSCKSYRRLGKTLYNEGVQDKLPKNMPLGIWNILSQRNQEMEGAGRTLTFPEAGHETSI
jgi:hypothetical protein